MSDIILNAVIFLLTLVLVIGFFRRDGRWVPERGKKAFRYFTCLSNVLCAVTALLTAAAAAFGTVPGWIWLLKYIGTAGVTVTMMTVFLFLAPSMGRGWTVLLEGSELFLHLITPLLAIVSFCVFEKRGMTFPQALWGLLPVVLYGPWYLYRTVYAPEDKRWEDFYGFNKGGRWPVSFAGMAVGTFLICMGIMALQNV